WWHRELSAYDLKIENPPMRAGKGTTDYNCGDDATYGSSGPYNGPSYKTWQDREKAYEFLVEEYCKGVMKNINNYGRAASDRELPSSESGYQYIGTKKAKSNDQCGTSERVLQ